MKKLSILLSIILLTACSNLKMVELPGTEYRFYCPVDLPEEWENTKGKTGKFELIDSLSIPVTITKIAYASTWDIGIAIDCGESRRGFRGCFMGSDYSVHYLEHYPTTENHELCHAYLANENLGLDGHYDWSRYPLSNN